MAVKSEIQPASAADPVIAVEVVRLVAELQYQHFSDFTGLRSNKENLQRSPDDEAEILSGRCEFEQPVQPGPTRPQI